MVTRSLAGGRSTKNNQKTPMPNSNHANFLLSCEEGLPSDNLCPEEG